MSSMRTAQLILNTVPRHARYEHTCTRLPGGLDELLVDGLRPGATDAARNNNVAVQASELAQETAGVNKPAVTRTRTGVAADRVDKPVTMNALPPRQIDAAVLLIGGMIAKDVAQALGVSQETVSRWRARQDFQDVMQALLQERYAATRMAMVSLAQDAVEELRCLIHGSNDMTRLRAIELVLNGLPWTRT